MEADYKDDRLHEIKPKYTDDETELIDNFLARFRTRKSKDNYRRIIKNFKKHLAVLGISFTEATKDQCGDFISNVEKYYGRKLSDKTKETIYSSLYSFYNYMKDKGIMAENPWNNVAKPKVPRSIRAEATMSAEEMHKFILAALKENERDRALALLFATTGLKTGEAIKIKWSHFVRDNNGNIGLYVEDRVDEKSRNVKIIDGVWEYLLDYRVSLGKSREVPLDDFSYVFLNEEGEPISESWALKAVKSICRKAKLDKEYPPSSMRHTFAKFVLMSLWVDNKGNAEEAAEIEDKLTQTMGWSQKYLIRRYEGVMYELEDAPVDKLVFNFKKGIKKEEGEGNN